jgi:hypothetical protein
MLHPQNQNEQRTLKHKALKARRLKKIKLLNLNTKNLNYMLSLRKLKRSRLKLITRKRLL